MGMMKTFDLFEQEMNEKKAEAEKAEADMKSEEGVSEEVVEFDNSHGEPEQIVMPAVVEVVETATTTDQVEIPPEVAYTHKGVRYKLVCEGVCIQCAHCGLKLTDADSIRMGIGPVCRKRGGYADEVSSVDDTEAMMALAQYPELVDYLVKKYKPGGNKELCNGLVRTASLNRRTPVHLACTDALEALGYKRLASLLRESVSTVEIYEMQDNQDAYGLWIKRVDFNWSFWHQLKQLPGVHMTKFPKKATIVPKTHRKELAKLLVDFYDGLYIKTPKGSHKITKEWFTKMSK